MARRKDLRELLEPIQQQHKLPALAAAVVRDGRLTALGAVGVCRTGFPEKVSLQARWHLGSCTKSMTATLIARLIERGIVLPPHDLTSLHQSLIRLGIIHPFGTAFVAARSYTGLRVAHDAAHEVRQLLGLGEHAEAPEDDPGGASACSPRPSN